MHYIILYHFFIAALPLWNQMPFCHLPLRPPAKPLHGSLDAGAKSNEVVVKASHQREAVRQDGRRNERSRRLRADIAAIGISDIYFITYAFIAL